MCVLYTSQVSWIKCNWCRVNILTMIGFYFLNKVPRNCLSRKNLYTFIQVNIFEKLLFSQYSKVFILGVICAFYYSLNSFLFFNHENLLWIWFQIFSGVVRSLVLIICWHLLYLLDISFMLLLLFRQLILCLWPWLLWDLLKTCCLKEDHGPGF